VSDDKDEDEAPGVEQDDATTDGHDETPGVGDDKPTGVDTETAVEAINEQEKIYQDMNAQYGERKHRHGLRPRRPRDYKHVHTQIESTVMTQHSI
jgi:hypothetical protein